MELVLLLIVLSIIIAKICECVRLYIRGLLKGVDNVRKGTVGSVYSHELSTIIVKICVSVRMSMISKKEWIVYGEIRGSAVLSRGNHSVRLFFAYLNTLERSEPAAHCGTAYNAQWNKS